MSLLTMASVRELPTRVPSVRPGGSLTVVQLAAESGVKRWVLTHKHTDLKDDFQRRAGCSRQSPARSSSQTQCRLDCRVSSVLGTGSLPRPVMQAVWAFGTGDCSDIPLAAYVGAQVRGRMLI
jgi:hypothetical protein